MTIRHPPGRAGKVWLRDRLVAAHHGADLLERKQAVLVRERRRLAALTDQTGRAWRDRCAEVGPPTMRLLLLGGRPALERAGRVAPAATARVGWRSAMGVTYPATVEARLADPPAVSGPASMGAAIDAHRQALEAAVQHAAASAALARVEAELAGTGQRLRAVRDRLVPRLEEAAATLELALDESEREESVRSTWARADGGSSTDRGGPGR